METLLKSITREPYGTTIADVIAGASEGEEVSIVFRAANNKREERPLHILGTDMRRGHEYIVKVKHWMTEFLEEDNSQFIQPWDRNTPMPFRVMRGRVLSETRGMLYMDLKACTLRTDYCMRCGKPLTHPVSKLYGLGPECGKHYYINPFNTEEELYESIQEVRRKLNNITWTGWIPKFGVEYATEVLPNGSVVKR